MSRIDNSNRLIAMPKDKAFFKDKDMNAQLLMAAYSVNSTDKVKQAGGNWVRAVDRKEYEEYVLELGRTEGRNYTKHTLGTSLKKFKEKNRIDFSEDGNTIIFKIYIKGKDKSFVKLRLDLTYVLSHAVPSLSCKLFLLLFNRWKERNISSKEGEVFFSFKELATSLGYNGEKGQDRRAISLALKLLQNNGFISYEPPAIYKGKKLRGKHCKLNWVIDTPPQWFYDGIKEADGEDDKKESVFEQQANILSMPDQDSSDQEKFAWLKSRHPDLDDRQLWDYIDIYPEPSYIETVIKRDAASLLPY